MSGCAGGFQNTIHFGNDNTKVSSKLSNWINEVGAYTQSQGAAYTFAPVDAVKTTGWVSASAPNLATHYIQIAIDNAEAAYEDAKLLMAALGNYAKFDPIATDVTWPQVNKPWEDVTIDPYPTKPVLDDIPDPTATWTYTEVVYYSDLLDALKAKLLEDLNSGGTGLSATVEADIYARESERDKLTLADTQDRIMSRWSESGLALPDGILNAALTWADLEYQNRYSDKSRKIAEDSLKITIENTRFTTERSVQLEDILDRINTENNKIKLEAAKAILESSISIFEALVKEQVATVELYKGESDAYRAYVGAVTDVAKSEVLMYEAETNYNKESADVLVKEIEMDIKQLELRVNVSSEIARAVASVAAQLASGSLSAINAGASVGFSGSESKSTSNSASNSSSQSYNFSDSTSHGGMMNSSVGINVSANESLQSSWDMTRGVTQSSNSVICQDQYIHTPDD